MVLVSHVPMSAMDCDIEAQSENSVSFIYYPAAREYPKGHAELEIAGTSWNKIDFKHYEKKQLRNMIAKSTEDGFPFFRFLFKAESGQIRKIQDFVETKDTLEFICSRIVLAPLHEAGVCSVPMPFSISPLLTAAYLTTGKKLGLNNVQKIEYYGNPSLKQSLVKIVPGVLTESAILACLGYGSWVTYRIYRCVQEDEPKPCL